MINKPGGTAKVTVIETIATGWRYHLESDRGEIGGLDTLVRVADLEVGDELDYEGDFQSPDRISFGGLVLFEPPLPTKA